MSSPCGVAPVVAADAQPNIFSEQQEQWLGDAMADALEGSWTPVRDPGLNAHVQAIADRLVATLPPTSIPFRVVLIDSSEVNGLSIAGGHIYLTRKLAAAAANDDELAGVIGHEIGHIASHQFAFETTGSLRRLTGVTSVGDRADVYAKFQALIDAEMKNRHPPAGDTDEKQDEADRIGVYASAAAGYRPEASAELWDRVFFVQGKTGGRVSDFFRITKPNEKRLRELRALVAALPHGCGGTRAADGQSFAAWHDAVVANQAGTEVATTKALKEVPLAPLHMELDRLRFSPDGKSILAQDESSIFVLSREPFALRYRIDAEGALPANFSPDSQSVTFSTPGLHTERWSATERKLIEAHEILASRGCAESMLSPDGRTLICVSFDAESDELALSMLDAATSAVVWEQKAWATASPQLALQLLISEWTGEAFGHVYSALSPDGNTLLLGSGAGKLFFDLRSRTVIKVGALSYKTWGEYAFVGNDKLVSTNPNDLKHSGMFHFPDGKDMKIFPMAGAPISSVTNAGDSVHLLQFGDKLFDVALFDPTSSKYLLLLKSHALDEYGDAWVAETSSGAVALMSLDKPTEREQDFVKLPLSPLAELRAVAASPDGRYIAVSTRYRGALWNTETGKQIALLHGFTDAHWTADDTLYLDVSKQLDAERHIAEISMQAHTLKTLSYKVDDETHMRYGRLTDWKLDAKKTSWTLGLHDPETNAVMWQKQFPEANFAYTASLGDRDLLFSFVLKSKSAKEAMKADSRLEREGAAIKDRNRARLIEVIDGKTGAEAGSLVMEMPPNYSDANGLNRAGDLLYVTGEDDRTAVYSLSTGTKLRELFGVVRALDPESGRVCTTNRVGEALVYDANGAELAHFELGQPIRYAQLRDDARLLTVLTSDQTLRTLRVGAEETHSARTYVDGSAVSG